MSQTTNAARSAPQPNNARTSNRLLIAGGLCLATVIACYANLAVYADTFKTVTLCVLLGLCLVFLLNRFGGELRRRVSLPWLPLLAYLLLCGLGVCWAQSGKFFLKEYARLLIGFGVFVAIALCLPKTKRTVWRLTACLVGAAAVYAAASVDLASLRLSAGFWNSIDNYVGMENGFESGTRLTGIFGNGNVLAGILGLGVLLGLSLQQSAQTAPQRLYAAAMVSVCAFGFLLAFSMGATAFFALAALVYLLFAGRTRGGVLLRMVFAAVPTFLLVFATFSCFGKTGAALALPLGALVLNAGAAMALEWFAYPRVSPWLEARPRLTLAALLVILILVTGPVQLAQGDPLRRAVYPAGGDNQLLIDLDGEATAYITSQNEREVMMHTVTVLYYGPADEAVFRVPEDSRVVYVNLRAQTDVLIRSARLGSGQTVPLDYPLLPGFIANRLQGLWANENAIQRTVFFADGIELFRDSPLVGLGLGAFESASWGVQEFDYETKYVHNHYIQVLLDSGVLGLVFFGLFALCLVLVLWRARRQEDDFRALWPACLACLVLILGHAVMEVTLSAGCYLPFAYGVFGLVTLCFSRPLCAQPDPAETEAKPARARGKASKAPRPDKSAAALVSGRDKWLPRAVRFLALGLSCVYLVLLGLNMIASNNMRRQTSGYDAFYAALKTDIALDAFERNDAILSYVINAPGRGDPDTLARADEYADDLTSVRSNAIQNYLVAYYLKRGNAEGAIRAAQNGADFNRASQEVWNALFTTFHTYLLGSEAGNYDFDRSRAAAGVLELYERMCWYNDTVLWAPIELNETARALVTWCQTQ